MHAQTWPAAATKQASVLASDWLVFTFVGLAIALLVWSLIIYALVRWRARAKDGLPPQFRNNFALEIAWTAIPLLIVCGLFLYTYRAEARVDGLSPDPALTIHVTAYRWGWTFAYDGGPVIGGAGPEMVLPLNEVARIEVASRDIDHSFWVPDFLFKRDAIPGQVTAFDLEPDKLGSYVGHCAEFCGLNHALMNFSVTVVSDSDFQRWRRETRGR
jgi:cytochrome c oxidase subunit II